MSERLVIREEKEGTVELEADRYRWVCQNHSGGCVNEEREVTVTVRCWLCGKVYEVSSAYHALNW